MTRVEQTATAFLVTSLGAAQKHTLQLFNSIEKGRFRVALAYLKGAEHVLPQITPGCALQEWYADFRRGWDIRGLNRLNSVRSRFYMHLVDNKDGDNGEAAAISNNPRNIEFKKN